MNRFAWLLLFFLLLTSRQTVFAATGRVECNSTPSKILGHAVPYCVILPPSFDSQKSRQFSVLYFLHGLGDDEQSFIHTGAWNVTEDLLESGDIKEFVIATPRGGANFYIDSRDGKIRYEDFLLQEFFPFIEKRFRVASGRGHRAVAGISMGGYGALHLAFRHPQLFSSAGAHSAALIEKLPAFLGGSPNSPRARVLGEVFGTPPDAAFWDRNSPLTLARTADLSGLKIYFDCGDQDGYGFEAGASALDKILNARHIQHEYHIYSGRHDAMYFGEHLPASLEFASHAFSN
jgi:S-formylglutathione hydrolase FrmB